MNTITETTEQWAIRLTLADYRARRGPYRSPYWAACEVNDADARHVAEAVVGSLPTNRLEQSAARYKASKALLAAVTARADIGGDRKFHELTDTEKFWNTGRVIGRAS